MHIAQYSNDETKHFLKTREHLQDVLDDMDRWFTRMIASRFQQALACARGDVQTSCLPDINRLSSNQNVLDKISRTKQATPKQYTQLQDIPCTLRYRALHVCLATFISPGPPFPTCADAQKNSLSTNMQVYVSSIPNGSARWLSMKAWSTSGGRVSGTAPRRHLNCARIVFPHPRELIASCQ